MNCGGICERAKCSSWIDTTAMAKPMPAIPLAALGIPGTTAAALPPALALRSFDDRMPPRKARSLMHGCWSVEVAPSSGKCLAFS